MIYYVSRQTKTPGYLLFIRDMDIYQFIPFGATQKTMLLETK